MNSYKRLSPSEREELALQLALGLSLRLIAKSQEITDVSI